MGLVICMEDLWGFVSFMWGAHEISGDSGFGLNRPRDGAADSNLIRQAG